MSNFFSNLKVKKIFLTSFLLLSFASEIILFSIPCDADSQIGSLSLFKTAFDRNNINLLSVIYLVLLIAIFILFSIAVFFILKQKDEKNSDKFMVLSLIGLTAEVLILFFDLSYPLFSILQLVIHSISIFFLLLFLIYSFLTYYYTVIKKSDDKKNKTNRILSLAISILSIISVISIFFSPFLTSTDTFTGTTTFYSLLSAIFSSKDEFIKPIFYFFLSFLISFFVLFMFFIGHFLLSLRDFYNDEKRYYKSSNASVLFGFMITLFFFVCGLVMLFILNKENISSLSFIPFIIQSVLFVLSSIFAARYEENKEVMSEVKKTNLAKKVLILVTFIILIATFVSSLFFDILKIDINNQYAFAVTPIDMLKNYTNNQFYKAVAFLLLTSGTVIFLFLLTSICLLLSKSRFFTNVIFAGIIIEFFVMFAISVFGIYYSMLENLKDDILQAIAKLSGITVTITDSTKVSITTQSYIFFLIQTFILIVLMFLKPFSSLKEEEELVKATVPSSSKGTGNALNEKQAAAVEKKEEEKALASSSSSSSSGEDKIVDFDSCPAFSELDSLKSRFDFALEKRKESEFIEPTLPSLVSYLVQYAANSRLHLSYKKEDMATFIAGLSMTRLSILQGMSGTGKTSLPKIFSEALMSNCEIIEVESSWKDKNELIGYYNDFSKVFTPKKFTQALYKASLNPDVITFIVLDEMNLSRIEYYFSDFLSLMENEEDKREIKLLNVKLYNTIDGKKNSYLSLKDDHTLKIPTNVFFIGTANRDESTFEISDKVYDRANTINFDRRATPVKDNSAPLDKRYLSYPVFKKLLDDAKSTYQFDLGKDERVKRIEDLLSPYNISFGNRVYNQINDFVKVYCSCFEDREKKEDEALEKILFSKVVHKLEFKSVEDKDYLKHEFERLGFYICSEFISKLNGDF